MWAMIVCAVVGFVCVVGVVCVIGKCGYVNSLIVYFSPVLAK